MTDDLFKIKEERENFVVNRNGYDILTLLRPQTLSVSVQQTSIIAKKNDGSYDLYVPCRLSSTNYNRPIFVANISEYQFFGDLFAIKMAIGNCWKIFFLKNLAKDLSEHNVAERLSQLPSIPYEKKNAAHFKKEFETLYNYYAECYGYYFGIFTSGSSDYLLTVEKGYITNGIKISHLGKVELLSGGNGIYFKSTDNSGNVNWHNFLRKVGPYADITELATNEYPACFPSSEFVGYSRKDAKGYICHLDFLSKASEQHVEVPINQSAKEIKFVQEYPLQIAHDGAISGKTELWKVSTPDDIEMLLMIFRGKGTHDRYTLINSKDLFS